MYELGILLYHTPMIWQAEMSPEMAAEFSLEPDIAVSLKELKRISQRQILLAYRDKQDLRALHQQTLQTTNSVIYGAGIGFRQSAGEVIKTVRKICGQIVRFRGYLRFHQAIAAAENGFALKLNRNGDYSTKMRYHNHRQRIIIENEVPFAELKYGWVIDRSALPAVDECH
ncbi:hypothetical protein VST7929_00865 [Vibrio stylophorae]|uniref:Uncharacterized protein n=1 Tax=Vibrio stylophorae TaxID=659351 RepID=A0ABN8DS42_9VIBR|nr:hypothetical protein [Vibrio stylophorae]CAH0533014.1 hypothetical protein VST7929_00865 [Vibrio stylophorae]